MEPSNRSSRSTLTTTPKWIDHPQIGIALLLAATLVALVWANSPWAPSYQRLLHVPLGVSVGSAVLRKPLLLWINDGLMGIFFFLVGLEIKRELLVGLLALVGDRVPAGLRVFLAALAIVDDIGAVLVIAVFYTDTIAVASLVAGLLVFAIAIAANRARVRNPLLYFLLGTLVWLAFLNAALAHPVSMGIILGLVVGKPLGIVVTSFVAVRLRVAELPDGIRWAHVAAVGMLAGVGFTMALFVSSLAFEADAAAARLVSVAKTAILVGSFVSAVVGVWVLRRVSDDAKRR